MPAEEDLAGDKEGQDAKVITDQDQGVFKVVRFSRRSDQERGVGKLLALQKIARHASEPKIQPDDEARFKTPE